MLNAKLSPQSAMLGAEVMLFLCNSHKKRDKFLNVRCIDNLPLTLYHIDNW